MDDDLDSLALGAGREGQQGMLIELELGQDAVEALIRRFGHLMIVK
jgi:hypothetical protein